MNQKAQDFMMRLKSDRRTQVGVVVIAAFIVMAIMMEGSKTPPPRRTEPVQISQTPLSTNAYEDILTAFAKDLETTKAETVSIKQDITQIRQDMEQNTQQTAQILRTLIQKVGEADAGGSARPASFLYDVPPGEAGSDPMVIRQDGPLPQDGLEPLLPEVPQVIAPPPPPQTRTAVIGAGDSVRVKLLAGVNAPVDGSPYPVVFKLASDVYGPDGSALPLGEARLIAAAQGSLTDARALFRLTSMNLRLPNGQRKIIDVDGWVVGEDGIRGMHGVLLDPIGKAIGASMFTAGLGALGEGLSAAQLETTRNSNGSTSQFIAGNTAEYAAGKAISGGASEWGRIVRDRVDQLVPQVQVLSGREATAVFARTVLIPDLYEALSSEDDF